MEGCMQETIGEKGQALASPLDARSFLVADGDRLPNAGPDLPERGSIDLRQGSQIAGTALNSAHCGHVD